MERQPDEEGLRLALEAEGLLDAEDPLGDRRFRAYKLLLDRGATIEDLRHYRSGLGLLAATLANGGFPTLTAQQTALRTGVSLALVDRLLLATGLPVTDPDVPVATEDDLVIFEIFAAGSAMSGEEVTLQLARVMSSGTSRIADALVSAFIGVVEPEVTEGDPSGLGLVRANFEVSELYPALMEALGRVLRRQVLSNARSSSEASVATAGYESRDLTVGFADMVGSSVLSSRLDTAELGAFFGEFEARAADVVVRNHGRVVKLIGDGIMFITTIPQAGLSAAVDLVEAFRDHPRLPPVRAGLAHGSVLAMEGDCFGPVVNLAARIVTVAPAGSILIGEELTPYVSDAQWHTENLGAHSLKGFADPVVLFRLTSRDCEGQVS
jgi:class 3 adenylate cyclase